MAGGETLGANRVKESPGLNVTSAYKAFHENPVRTSKTLGSEKKEITGSHHLAPHKAFYEDPVRTSNGLKKITEIQQFYILSCWRRLQHRQQEILLTQFPINGVSAFPLTKGECSFFCFQRNGERGITAFSSSGEMVKGD